MFLSPPRGAPFARRSPPVVSCGKLARLDPDGLDRAGPSMVERQVDRGRDPPVGEERQPVDQFLVDLHDVSAGRLHLPTAANENGWSKVTLSRVVRIEPAYALSLEAQSLAT